MKLKLSLVLLYLFFFQIAFSQVANPVPNLHFCDNDSDGDDTNGLVQNINLEVQTAMVLGSQSAADFTVSYHAALADAQNGINNLVSPFSNTIPNVQTIYARVTENSSNNFDTTNFNIVVNPVPSVNAQVVELKQCDDDTDGFSNFNLTDANTIITNTPGIYDFSYHITLADAINNTNPIVNSTSYTNITPTTDTVWARVMDTGNGCFKTSQVNLVVSTTTIPSSFQREFQEEDDLLDINGNNNSNNDNTDGITTFDFSSVDADVRALFPVTQQLTIAYYRNNTDALAEQNAITDIANYRNIGYPGSQSIYIRVDSNLDNGCLDFDQHITLTVTPSTLSLYDENKLNASVYPNPANNDFLIQLHDGILNDVTISLYDLQGKIILKSKITANGHPKIDISRVNNGIYFVKVQTNEKSLIKKLIVAHN